MGWPESQCIGPTIWRSCKGLSTPALPDLVRPNQRLVASHNSARSRKAETAAVAVRVMKRMSMNVFTPASRTRGVGHRLGEATKDKDET